MVLSDAQIGFRRDIVSGQLEPFHDRHAIERFEVSNALAIHRSGLMELSEVAVVVAVSSPHRDAAFNACRYIIDQAKVRLPIWKKEHYANGQAEWVNCQHCAEAGHRHG